LSSGKLEPSIKIKNNTQNVRSILGCGTQITYTTCLKPGFIIPSF